MDDIIAAAGYGGWVVRSAALWNNCGGESADYMFSAVWPPLASLLEGLNRRANRAPQKLLR